MFGIITKREYWQWLEEGYFLKQAGSIPHTSNRLRRIWGRSIDLFRNKRPYELKDVQDSFILSRLPYPCEEKRILEVGGGNPRILRMLTRSNECWLVDKYEGVGRGPSRIPKLRGVQIVLAHMGDFSDRVPDNYFDYIFSVSVMEHVPLERLDDFMRDCARVLRISGRMIHAIDTYVFDQGLDELDSPFKVRIREYLEYSERPDLGIRLVSEPNINENFGFSCSFASLPDNVLHEWNLNRPQEKRIMGQVVSIKSEWEKYREPPVV